MNSAEYAKGIQWDRSVDVWAKGLADAAVVLLEQYLTAVVKYYAPIIESWLKENAPWQDRTGNARAGLHADTEILVGEVYSIILDHGDDVPYGIYLETRWQGKFAIIAPALDTFFPLIISDLKRFLK